MLRVFVLWVWAAAAVTAVLGVIYVTIQQNYRNGANDPQIEIVEDTAARLEASAAILDQVPQEKIDAQHSLAPFVIIFDTEGNAIAGNGYLGATLLSVPKGVFDEAKASGEYRVTLEPQKGVRIAAVVKPFVGREANGFVLSGRSLREVEVRVDDLTKLIALGWAATLAGLAVLAFFSRYLLR